jgi:hypothetical protein
VVGRMVTMVTMEISNGRGWRRDGWWWWLNFSSSVRAIL